MGSGSLAAMAVLETQWHEGMTVEEGMSCAHDAICAGILNDMGSGGFVDVMVITRDKATMHRNMDKPAPRAYRNPQGYPFARGTTAVLAKEVHVVVTPAAEETLFKPSGPEDMEY